MNHLKMSNIVTGFDWIWMGLGAFDGWWYRLMQSGTSHCDFIWLMRHGFLWSAEALLPAASAAFVSMPTRQTSRRFETCGRLAVQRLGQFRGVILLGAALTG